MGFRLAQWPLTTLNCPNSRSLQLQSNISIMVYWMQSHWADTLFIEHISCFKCYQMPTQTSVRKYLDTHNINLCNNATFTHTGLAYQITTNVTQTTWNVKSTWNLRCHVKYIWKHCNTVTEVNCCHPTSRCSEKWPDLQRPQTINKGECKWQGSCSSHSGT